MSGNFFMMSNDIFNGDITPYRVYCVFVPYDESGQKNHELLPDCGNNRFGL